MSGPEPVSHTPQPLSFPSPVHRLRGPSLSRHSDSGEGGGEGGLLCLLTFLGESKNSMAGSPSPGEGSASCRRPFVWAACHLSLCLHKGGLSGLFHWGALGRHRLASSCGPVCLWKLRPGGCGSDSSWELSMGQQSLLTMRGTSFLTCPQSRDLILSGD